MTKRIHLSTPPLMQVILQETRSGCTSTLLVAFWHAARRTLSDGRRLSTWPVVEKSSIRQVRMFVGPITLSRKLTSLLRAGLIVQQRNYLEVFPYDKWSDKELPQFEEGEEFMPSICELRDGQTTRPNLLTEADLVSLMDKNGIGR